jgi:ribosomal protein S18 acetylase RimI-like enzyme
MPLTIRDAQDDDLPCIRTLFRAYGASLGYDLCFQGFEEELAGLPGRYEPPGGRLLLGELDGTPVGCVALRALDETTCEMKRLYLDPRARGTGAGRALAERIVEAARGIGYRRMVLDTIPSMSAAVALYRTLGFTPIAPYYPNPIPGVLYLQLGLEP